MKRLALFALASSTLLAQTPAPAPTLPGGGQPPPEMPAPSAPVARATPVNSPAPAASPVEAKSTPPPPQTSVDALSAAEVQQALTAIKSSYLKPESLAETTMSRATLQGLMDRLAPGVLLAETPKPEEQTSPFRSEILLGTIGYLRLGDLGKSNLGELDNALKNFADQAVKAAILDLRATPATNVFEPAAELCKRFCAKGKLLFTLKKSGAKPERVFTATLEPAFRGLLVVLVDDDTAGAAEVIGAVLRAQAKALVVGAKTKGEAVEFAEVPLHGKLLRIADAEVSVPEAPNIYPDGVKPDITVAMSAGSKEEVMAAELEKGVTAFVTDTPRAHMNEAALVLGANPEIDAFEAAQRNPQKKPALRDVQLQRAVDLAMTIGVYENKPARSKTAPQ